MKRALFIVCLIASCVFLTNCAKQRNEWKSKGGFWASSVGGTNADYIVVSQSGGEIMDVWKLKGCMVQSPEASDGWLFFDEDDNSIYVGGDVKIIRMNDDNKDLWDKYFDYHMEHETLPYREKFSDKIKELD